MSRDVEWGEDVLWLLDAGDGVRWPLAAALDFANRGRAAFRPACDPGNRIFFEPSSTVNHLGATASRVTRARAQKDGPRPGRRIMEAASIDALTAWTRRWDDLVDFEIIPVLTSADFWSKRQPPGEQPG